MNGRVDKVKARTKRALMVAGVLAVAIGAHAEEPARSAVPPAASAPGAGMAKPVAAREAARVYQQRTPEGGVLLTDRPLDEARTERTWAMEREDPDAARVRSERVSTEAKTVSERVQRRIDLDQQRLDAEIERTRVAAAASAEAQRRAADAEPRYAIGGYWPLANAARHRQPPPPRADNRPAPRPGRHGLPCNAPVSMDREP